jgi:hypothetical protein
MEYHSYHHIFVLASLLVIVICPLSSIIRLVTAETDNSSIFAKVSGSNSSSKLENKTTANATPSDVIQIYLPIITAIITGASAAAAWFTRSYAKKSFHFNAFVKAFELLNDNAHRNARIRLYRVAGVEDYEKRNALLKELGVKDESLKTIIPESQNIVLADLNQMGTLVKNGLILEEEFLDVYWNTVISCYEVLKDEEKTKLYADFKDLYDRANRHKRTNVPLEKDVFGSSASMMEYKEQEHAEQTP